MARYRACRAVAFRWALALVACLAGVTSSSAWGVEHAPTTDSTSTPPSTDPILSAQELAEQIDALIAAGWNTAGVEPAPPCDDATFLRRVSLDLAGRIPSIGEVREFFDDPRPEKRREAVERLLNHASFAAHFANVWRGLLLPGANNNAETRTLLPPLEAWLRLRFAERAPYDRLVTEVLTTRVTVPSANVVPTMTSTAPTPAAFFFANERKPESLASSASRLFLGVQLQCAECHDHPFADWKRDEFWSFAAFFRDVAAPPMPVEGETTSTAASNEPGLEIPGTGRRALPRYLRDVQSVPDDENQRVLLARWLTSAENPYFARATVNRLWGHLLGYGLIEPIDDVSVVNPPSHPEVLDLLISQFVAHRFDLSYLIQAIVSTRAYQLSSGGINATDLDPRLFARMPIKTLTAEQLFDSLVEATGYRPARAAATNAVNLGEGSARSQFVARFGVAVERPAEGESSILLALAMMNGELIGSATNVDNSELLTAVSEAPFFDTAGRVETLFLATLSRRPAPEELRIFVEHIQSRQKVNDEQALADVFWALLNSSEFQLNH